MGFETNRITGLKGFAQALYPINTIQWELSQAVLSPVFLF